MPRKPQRREPETLACVEVSRAELETSLRTLRHVVPRKGPPQALVSFEKGALVIRIGGVSVGAAAAGRWNGVARLSGVVLANFDRSLPECDPVPVRVVGGHVKIGPVGLPCHWQSQAADAVRVPVDAGLLHLLQLLREHDLDAIEAAGLRALVEEAEAKQEALFARAARVLAPLEIGPDELAECVARKLAVRFGAE